MDDPQIQYTRTSDGADIAYWTMGDGPPLLWLPIQPVVPWRAWHSMEEARAWDDRLAEKWTLVEFDPRGVGLSASDDYDHSLDACATDIEAVADAAGLDRFAIFAGMLSGPAAVAYVARHPERVSHLILWCSFAKSDDYRTSPQALGARAVGTDSDWPTLAQTLWRAAWGRSRPELVDQFSDVLVSQVTRHQHETGSRILRGDDVTGLLPHVETETLIIHREDSIVPSTLGRTLAAGLPNARLLVIEGDSIVPFVGNADLVFDTIREFIGTSAPIDAQPTDHTTASDFRSILFTDVEESTLLTAQYGDAKARELLQQHERITRDSLAAHGGTEIKTMGDGFMASFTSASSGIDAAIAMQRAITDHFEATPTPIRIRIGINAGEPIAENDDLYGTAVIQAARIMGHADGGEILVSDTVRGLVAGKPYLFSQKGEFDLKGFEEPVRLFEVDWRDTD
jgi:class 3 adenylate cyclase